MNHNYILIFLVLFVGPVAVEGYSTASPSVS